jgi:hypothetical protein
MNKIIEGCRIAKNAIRNPMYSEQVAEIMCTRAHRRVYPKVSGLSHNEINNNKYSLRSNTKCYGSKTNYTDSQNSDTTVSNGREL